MAEKNIIELVGDFYQAHMNNEEEARTAALVKIEELVNKGYAEGHALADYFNDILSGRTGYNATLSISDYPKESIIRELFQNALGCHYKDGDIKIVVDFLQGNKVTISYNEVGCHGAYSLLFKLWHEQWRQHQRRPLRHRPPSRCRCRGCCPPCRA